MVAYQSFSCSLTSTAEPACFLRPYLKGYNFPFCLLNWLTLFVSQGLNSFIQNIIKKTHHQHPFLSKCLMPKPAQSPQWGHCSYPEKKNLPEWQLYLFNRNNGKECQPGPPFCKAPAFRSTMTIPKTKIICFPELNLFVFLCWWTLTSVAYQWPLSVMASHKGCLL